MANRNSSSNSRQSRRAPGQIKALPAPGALTSVVNGGDAVRIEGWVAAPGKLEGFAVHIGTQEQRTIEWRARAARDGRFRFRIAARVPARAGPGTLITVIPRIARRNTIPLFNALDSSLPLPSARDRAAVTLAADFLPKAFRSLSLLVGLARLRRDGDVLDVGCGVARVTYALAHYLSADGRYEGLDAVPRWVEWNRRTITSRFPRFRFSLVDVRNGLYRQRSRGDAAQLRFPYKDGAFDAVLVESVFQHNRVPVVRHYLTETARVLRRGGRCVVTGFVLRRGSKAADQRADGLNFLHPLDEAWSASATVPETGIAFEAARFERWVRQAGLDLVEFHRGDWHGEGPGLAYQDVIVLEKPGRRR